MIRSQVILSSLALALFVFVSIFGVNAAMDHVGKNGQMGSCPFMGEMTAVCSMSVTEHLSQWAQSFLTIPAKSYAAILLTLLLIYSAFASTARSIKEKYNLSSIKNRIALGDAAYPKLSNHLRAAFSRGILHSRIYA